MRIDFIKMFASGNDFMLIDALSSPQDLSVSTIKALADRHTGIGFDQLLMLRPASHHDSDFAYHIYNADGSEVYQCGNGARCVGRYIFDQGLNRHREVRIATKKNVLTVSKQGEEICVNLGDVCFSPTNIPLDRPQEQGIYYLTTPQQTIAFAALNIGNPHAVLIVDNMTIAPVAELGAFFNQASDFPEGVNVGFMQIIDQHHIKLRVYERGVGETMACGSGAAAAVVAGCQQQQLTSPVLVTQAGGNLHVDWDVNSKQVSLRGDAHYAFSGEVDLTQYTKEDT